MSIDLLIQGRIAVFSVVVGCRKNSWSKQVIHKKRRRPEHQNKKKVSLGYIRSRRDYSVVYREYIVIVVVCIAQCNAMQYIYSMRARTKTHSLRRREMISK